MAVVVLATAPAAQATGPVASGSSGFAVSDGTGDVLGSDPVTADEQHALDISQAVVKTATHLFRSGRYRVLRVVVDALPVGTPDPALGVIARTTFRASGHLYRTSAGGVDRAVTIEVLRDGHWRNACRTSCGWSASQGDRRTRFTTMFRLKDIGDPRRLVVRDIRTFLPGTDRTDEVPGRHVVDLS